MNTYCADHISKSSKYLYCAGSSPYGVPVRFAENSIIIQEDYIIVF